MTKDLQVKDFFNPDGKLPKNSEIKFERLIKYLDYMRETSYSGCVCAYDDILDYLMDTDCFFEEFTLDIVKGDLLEPTVCLKYDGKEYVYKMDICLVWLLDPPNQRLSKLVDGIAESYGCLFEDCTLYELMQVLGKNRNASEYGTFYYNRYGEVNILPFLLANKHPDVVKWALKNMAFLDIELDFVQDLDETNNVYDANIPGWNDFEILTLKTLLYFLDCEKQSPVMIEYIRTHIKNGREILEDPKIQNLIVELKSDTPDWNSIYGMLDYFNTKGIVILNDYHKEVYLIPFGALNGVDLDIPEKNIENLKKYLKRNSNGK